MSGGNGEAHNVNLTRIADFCKLMKRAKIFENRVIAIGVYRSMIIVSFSTWSAIFFSRVCSLPACAFLSTSRVTLPLIASGVFSARGLPFEIRIKEITTKTNRPSRSPARLFVLRRFPFPDAGKAGAPEKRARDGARARRAVFFPDRIPPFPSSYFHN